MNHQANAFVSQLITHRLLESLPMIRLLPTHVLNLGVANDDTSRFLKTNYPSSRITEFSLNCTGYPESLPFASDHFDLVIANLLLPCNSHWGKLCQEIYRVLKAPGLLLCSSLGSDTLYEVRNSWEMIEGLPQLDSFYDIPETTDSLFTSGFRDIVIDHENIIITYSNFRQLYADLMGLGWNAFLTTCGKILKNQGDVKRFLQEYRKCRQKENNRLPVTFEIVYAHAWRFESTVNQEIQIPVSAIRGRK